MNLSLYLIYYFPHHASVIIQLAMFVISSVYIIAVVITNSFIQKQTRDQVEILTNRKPAKQFTESPIELDKKDVEKKLDIDIFGISGVGAAILFALPAVRGIQPGIPDFGCLADIFYTWDIVALSLGL